jgi:hypothetical protein
MEEALIVLTYLKSSVVLLLLPLTLCANEAYIITNGDGNSLSIIQDGIDNYIDLTANDFEDAFMEIEQTGNDNSVDLIISGGTGTGSSFDIYQDGNNNSYSADLWCSAEWCTLTVTQP